MEAIIFDLGNTLIKVNSNEHGPMVNWARLEFTGLNVVAVIKQLSAEYRLFIATNAQDSSSNQVLETLGRVNLGGYFEKVFSARGLRLKKTESEFYRKILDDLEMLPEEVLMVGDDYLQDILVPASLDIKTCFYNPEYSFDANGVIPIHTFEVNQFADLLNRVNKPVLPSINECHLWLLENGASYGILQHVQTVAIIAYDLAVRIAASGENIDPILAHRSGLLHDIDKLHPDSSRERHGKLGGEILRRKGFEDIAVIIERHTVSPNWQPGEIPETWEQKIVFYADKLVKGQTIVSLDERLSDLITRYPSSQGSFENNLENIRDLESTLMTAMDYTPQEYLAVLKQKLHGAKRLPGNS